MKIAMVGTPFYTIPPKGYGGIEIVIGTLVDGLIERGHDVTLFGVGERSETRAKFVSTSALPSFGMIGKSPAELIHSARVDNALKNMDFDIIHDHSFAGPLTARHRKVPTVITVHGDVDGFLGDYYYEIGDAVSMVAISDSQRRSRPELNWVGRVHHAVNMSDFVPEHHPDGPALWLGRFHSRKGPDLAIKACRVAEVPLVLAGKCIEPEEIKYYDEVIVPLLNSNVKVVLNANRDVTNKLLTESRCLIMSIRWDEPFGMVLIEAFAAGSPVVAMNHGSIPEIVEHGKTGWICNDSEELPEALLRVNELDYDTLMETTKSRFSSDRMAREYEEIYRQVLTRTR